MPSDYECVSHFHKIFELNAMNLSIGDKSEAPTPRRSKTTFRRKEKANLRLEGKEKNEVSKNRLQQQNQQ